MKRLVMAIVSCGFIAATLVTTTRPASASTQMTWSTITTGYDHTCGLTSSGAAYCWGGNAYGQLGNGTTSASPSLAPVAVGGGHTFTAIAGGGYSTCAIDTSQAAWCWGNNASGQLGDNTYNTQSSPVAVVGSHLFTSISMGDQSTVCAITTAHDSYCWGDNYYGAFGDSTQNSVSIPQLTLGSHLWASISVDEQGTCGVTTTNVGYCWGIGNIGHLGVGDNSDHFTPTLIAGGHSWLAVATNLGSTCGLDTSGAAWCWGGNGPVLGDGGVNFNSNYPVAVTGGHTFVSIAGGTNTTCAATSSGSTYCWGVNSTGSIGDGTTQDRDTPTLVSGSQTFNQLSASYHYACGLTAVGIAYCWGNNADGELGDGTTTERDVPTSTYYSASTTTISGIVDPNLVFTVAGRSSVCNGQSATNFQTTATPTGVTLGHLNAATVGGGAQDLNVATNAANGFVVYLRTSGTTPNSFRDGGGHSIADLSGTNASPGSAPVAGTAGFGYTSSDTATPFTSNTWAKVTNSNDSVLIGTAGTTSKSACIGYEAAVAVTTPAGSYSTTIIYTALPSF